jgi:NACHT domain
MLGERRRPGISIRSGKLGRLTSRYNRWFAGSAIAVALLLAIALAFVPLPEPFSGGRGFFGNLDRSMITPGVLAVAAYFWFNFWTTHRATRELLLVARRTPEQLFPHSPEAGSAKHVFGRRRLVTEIADGLCSQGPQIVVGGTGSGKTTLLLALADHLANEHFIVPIVLSLRDKDDDLAEKDFTELAFKRFGQLVDPYVKTETDADKLWRWMCSRGRIVVLADDLDRSRQVNDDDPYRTRIRLALDTARRRNLPLVVTTRPSGLPPDLSELPIDLSDYGLEGKSDAADYVLERAGQVGDDTRKLVKRNIKEGDLLENAFYLTLLARLLRIDALKEPAGGGRHAVRLGLLDADRRRLCGDEGLDEDERRRRDIALHGVEDLAAAWLVPKNEVGFDPRWLGAVRDGERFGLLSLDDQRHPQFKHEVLHAYYASRAIARGSPWKQKLNQRPNGARMQLALILTAARGEDEAFCREACDRLLADVEGLTPDQRLLRAAAAAELARAGSFSERDPEIAAGCLRERADAGPVTKRAALEQLETLGGERAIDALWVYAQDDDYGTRWAAVESLVRRCSERIGAGGVTIRPPFQAEAYEIVDPKIAAALAGARPLVESPEHEPVDDWDRRIVPLKQLAWMLPSLRTGAKDTTLRERIDAHLQELLRLERDGVSYQRGLEASIAQGFKTDARLHPDEPPDPYAEQMLREQAVFWYSQLNLVQALALRMASDPDCVPDSLSSIVNAVEQRERERKSGWSEGAVVTADLHPMLRYAAVLCQKALKGKAGEERLKKMTRVVWEDEGVVVSRRPRKLDRAAAQLVGEITVLLNLNETGSPRQRRAFGEEVTLPYCLRRSRRRREFHDGCHKDCGFQLCPFQPAREEPSAHRELSRAFCRDQSLHANLRTARRWDSRVVPRALPDFWRWLEAQARF